MNCGNKKAGLPCENPAFVSQEGLEPSTHALKGHCSTTELLARETQCSTSFLFCKFPPMLFFLRSTILALFLTFFSAHAGDFSNWSTNSGQGLFSFLELFQGPRNTALSGTGSSAFTPDILATLVNPGNVLASPTQHTVAISWEAGALSQQEGLLAWRFNLGKTTLQTTYAWISNDPIRGLDESGAETGISYQPFDQSINLTAAYPFPDFTFGATAKWIRDHLSDDVGDYNAIGLAMDWGLVWKSPSPRYGFALSVLDLGKQFTPYTANGVDNLALNTRIKLSTHYRPVAIRGLTVYLDTDFPRYSQAIGRLGLEYNPSAWFQLRAGTARSLSSLVKNPASADLASVATGGLGVTWSGFTFDYSINILRDGFGQLHRLGLRTGF